MIDIKQEWLLPLPFRMVGVALMALGSILCFRQVMTWLELSSPSWNILIGLALFILGTLIASTHYRLRIHTEDKWLLVYVWILGIKSGKPVHYNHIDKIYINRVLQSRGVSSYTGHRNEVRETLYKAYLKLDNGEKVHLDTDKDEAKLAERVEGYGLWIADSG